jgi:hypothetical protein
LLAEIYHEIKRSQRKPLIALVGWDKGDVSLRIVCRYTAFSFRKVFPFHPIRQGADALSVDLVSQN